MNRQDRLETGILLVGLVVLIGGLLIGLGSVAMFLTTLVVGVAVVAVWAYGYFRGRRKE